MPLGVVVHTAIFVASGIIFGLVASRLRTNAAIAVAGLVFGLLLYLVNFQLIGRFVLPQFQMTNQPFEVFAHVAFGAIVAPLLFRWSPRTAEAGSPDH